MNDTRAPGDICHSTAQHDTARHSTPGQRNKKSTGNDHPPRKCDGLQQYVGVSSPLLPLCCVFGNASSLRRQRSRSLWKS
jgi:hypothetical protein